MKDDPNQTFGFVVNDVARLLHRRFDRRAQTLGLTRAQWSVLAHLRRCDGLRQTDLADLLDISPISLTRLIDRLVKNDWLERRSDPDDRRTNRIFLSQKVRPLLDRLRTMGTETREEAFTGILKEERERFMATLLRIRVNLTNLSCPPDKPIDHRKRN